MATARGALWGLDNPAQAIALSQSILPDVSKEAIVRVINFYAQTRFWNTAAVLPRSSFDFTHGALSKVGSIKTTSLRYEDFFFPDFAMAAAARLHLTPLN